MPHGLDDREKWARVCMTLLGRSEPAGVVSIFVDAGPDVRGAAIDIRNRLSDLERRVALEAPTERSGALSATLRRIAPNVARLLDPRALGRGRALFAPVRGGDPIAYSTQLRLPNRVGTRRPAVRPSVAGVARRGSPRGRSPAFSSRGRSVGLAPWRASAGDPARARTA